MKVSRAFFSFILGLISLLVASRYFASFATMAAAGLTTAALGSTLRDLLEANRFAIWEAKESSTTANSKLAWSLLTIFLGLFSASAMFHLLPLSPTFLDKSLEMTHLNLFEILHHNIRILFAALFLGVIYQAGGAMLMLSWNALVWGEMAVRSGVTLPGDLHWTLASIQVLLFLPHIFLESVAYILSALAGIFVSKAICKYSIFSDEFFRVTQASLVLVLIAMVCVLFGGWLESLVI